MYNLKERISIQKGVYKNKTLMYLLPLIKVYGNEFISKFEQLKLKYCGIGDFNYDEEVGQNIFCVFEVANYRVFEKFEEYIRKQDFFVDSYIFSIKDNLHCFVFKFPYSNIIDKFLSGKYSEMFSNEDIDRLYLKTFRRRGVEYYTDVYSVLTKREEYKNIFLETVKEDFGAVDMVGDFEYDYPPILGMEVLNYEI